jgi:hypothetical protein
LSQGCLGGNVLFFESVKFPEQRARASEIRSFQSNAI